MLTDGNRIAPQVSLGIHFDGEHAIPSKAPPHHGYDTEIILEDKQGYSP